MPLNAISFFEVFSSHPAADPIVDIDLTVPMYTNTSTATLLLKSSEAIDSAALLTCTSHIEVNGPASLSTFVMGGDNTTFTSTVSFTAEVTILIQLTPSLFCAGHGSHHCTRGRVQHQQRSYRICCILPEQRIIVCASDI